MPLCVYLAPVSSHSRYDGAEALSDLEDDAASEAPAMPPPRSPMAHSDATGGNLGSGCGDVGGSSAAASEAASDTGVTDAEAEEELEAELAHIEAGVDEDRAGIENREELLLAVLQFSEEAGLSRPLFKRLLELLRRPDACFQELPGSPYLFEAAVKAVMANRASSEADGNLFRVDITIEPGTTVFNVPPVLAGTRHIFWQRKLRPVLTELVAAYGSRMRFDIGEEARAASADGAAAAPSQDRVYGHPVSGDAAIAEAALLDARYPETKGKHYALLIGCYADKTQRPTIGNISYIPIYITLMNFCLGDFNTVDTKVGRCRGFFKLFVNLTSITACVLVRL